MTIRMSQETFFSKAFIVLDGAVRGYNRKLENC